MKLFGQHVWCSGESLWLLHSSNLFSEAHICSDVTTVHLLDSSGNLFNPRTLTYIFVTPSLTLGVFYPKNYFSSTYIITQQYMIKWSNFLLFPSIKFLIKQKKYHGGGWKIPVSEAPFRLQCFPYSTWACRHLVWMCCISIIEPSNIHLSV